MSDLIAPSASLPAMSDTAISKVRALETAVAALPQEPLTTHHLIHGGMYARTICVPAGVIITGCLVKIPTIVITQGSGVVYTDGQSLILKGYNVIPASAGRKQVFVAETDLYITALFPTKSKTVAECEAEFTDETDMLASHKEVCKNNIVITGE